MLLSSVVILFFDWHHKNRVFLSILSSALKLPLKFLCQLFGYEMVPKTRAIIDHVDQVD